MKKISRNFWRKAISLSILQMWEWGAEASLIPDRKLLHKGMFVADCIYHPFETKLLSQAKEEGQSYMNGLPMLFYQAAEAFRLWTGKSFLEEGVFEELKRRVKG